MVCLRIMKCIWPRIRRRQVIDSFGVDWDISNIVDRVAADLPLGGRVLIPVDGEIYLPRRIRAMPVYEHKMEQDLIIA